MAAHLSSPRARTAAYATYKGPNVANGPQVLAGYPLTSSSMRHAP